MDDKQRLKALVNRYGGQTAFANRLDVSRQEINRVVTGPRKVSPELAIKIFAATGEKFGLVGEVMK